MSTVGSVSLPTVAFFQGISMIDLKSLTDEELWLLTCGIEQLHDSMRRNQGNYKGNIVEQANNIREELSGEFKARNIDYERWYT
jgi:hypothetical protein